MTGEGIHIRSAKPSDAPFLAWSILAATRSHLAKGWFDLALSRSEDFCLEFLQRLTTATTRSQWHYSGFVVAEVQSVPISALCSVHAAETYPLAPAAVLESLRACGLDQRERSLFWQRGAYMFPCTGRPDDDSLVIEVVATLPQHRRSGCTVRLLEDALCEGRAQGFRKAEVTCFIGNDSAQRVYERAGFRLVSQRRNPNFEMISGSPGVQRFLKDL